MILEMKIKLMQPFPTLPEAHEAEDAVTSRPAKWQGKRSPDSASARLVTPLSKYLRLTSL